MTSEHQGSPVVRVFKVVGYATALLTLGFGLTRVWVGVQDYANRQREIDELLGTADVLMIGANYRDAWDSVKRAEELEASTRVRRRMEDVAMAWLREASTPVGETFEGIVSELLPVVTRGATLSDGTRRADLLAHVGWAGYLRYRDGVASEFGRYYEDALALDPTNPFANAFLGHWTIESGGLTSDVEALFRTALESGRERPFVRNLQMAALTNRSSPDANAALIRMAIELHTSGEPLPDGFEQRLWSNVYLFVLANGSERQKENNLSAAPPAAHAAMFEAFFGPGSAAYRDARWERDLWLATILAEAGETDRARSILTETLEFLREDGAGINERYPELIREGLARLESPLAP